LPLIIESVKSAGEIVRDTVEEFWTEIDRSTIRARIYERGVGETLSSGTGASGAAIAHLLDAGALPGRAIVTLDGGELEVEVSDALDVNLTGWARPVFAGSLSEEFEKELHETE